MIPYTVRSMAETLGVEGNDLAGILTANTHEVYGTWDGTPASGQAAG
jgi:hypothetical protein